MLIQCRYGVSYITCRHICIRLTKMGRNRPRKDICVDRRGNDTKLWRPDRGCTFKADRCPCGLDPVIPWWSPWIIVLVTMVIRIYHVTRPENSWILHPDEIYQSVEVAFSQVYGYGFRPYEYLPPPGPGNTSIDQQHTLSGMFALRSFMFPRMFASVMQLAKLLGVDWNPLLICQVFNAIVTSMLSYSTYIYTRKLFRCHVIGVMTCALTASCLHLTIIGTHTLVNGFIAPFLFLGLTVCLPAVETDTESKRAIGEDVTESKHATSNGYTHVHHDVISDRNGNVLVDNNRHGSPLCSPDVKNNTDSISTYLHHAHPNGVHMNGININGTTLKHRNGYRNGIIQKNVPRKVFSNIKTRVDRLKHLQQVFGGSLLGLVCYIRIDTALFCLVTYLPMYIVKYKSMIAAGQLFRDIVLVFLGICVAFAICIIDDLVNYGIPYVSPVQWFKFNIISGKASTLFDNEHIDSYIKVICPDTVSVILNVCMLVVVIFDIAPNFPGIKTKRKLHCVATAASFTVLYIIYSHIGHKEVRFLHNCLILFVILQSYAIHTVIIWLRNLNVSPYRTILVIVLLISGYSANTYCNFPSAKEASIGGLSHGDAEESSQVSMCLNLVGQQDDVSGLFVNTSIFNMAGYSAIRHNVPVWVKLHNEYHVYETSKHNRLGNGSRIKVIGDFSDFIHKSNTFYIYELLTRDSKFNYVITNKQSSTILQRMHYSHISDCGRFALFRRDSNARQLPRHVIEALAPATSPEVFEYEASWLITNGQFSQAISRINQAFEVGGSRVRLYQQLAHSYANIGRTDKIPAITEKCYKRHGAEECSRIQEKVVLDKQYNRLRR